MSEATATVEAETEEQTVSGPTTLQRRATLEWIKTTNEGDDVIVDAINWALTLAPKGRAVLTKEEKEAKRALLRESQKESGKTRAAADSAIQNVLRTIRKTDKPLSKKVRDLSFMDDYFEKHAAQGALTFVWSDGGFRVPEFDAEGVTGFVESEGVQVPISAVVMRFAENCGDVRVPKRQKNWVMT